MISYYPMFGQGPCVPATRDPLDPFGDHFCKLSIFVAHMFHSTGTYQERPCKLLGEDVTTYQERLASYWAKMLQRIRNVLQVTGRRCYNVSGTSLQVTGRRCYNVSGTSLQVTGRRCYNVSGTSCKLLDEDATTYQERLASYWTKMLQRIRNVLQVTGRRCYDVSGNHYWQRRPQDAITPPPTPPQPPPRTPPPKKKRQCTKVTTVPPLEGRRHLKHLQSTVRHYWQKLKTMDFGRHGPFSSIFLHWFTTKQHGDLLAALEYLDNLIFTMRHCIYIYIYTILYTYIVIYIYIYI